MMTLVRIALLPIGLIIAFLAFVNAASGIGALPFTAAGHDGWLGLNAHILSELTDHEFKTELASHQTQSQQMELPQLSDSLIAEARASYAVNPLDAASLRTIALGGFLLNDKKRARELMRIAEKISKRDSVTNLWLAQDYGQLGNADEMLVSFDHALRTSGAVRRVAMKPVVETLAYSSSFAPLARLLSLHPEWEDSFWREFTRNPVGIANAAAFLSASQIPLEEVPEAYRSSLYANLKNAREFDSLVRLAALDPDLKSFSAKLAAGRFVTVDQGDPLAWTLHSKGTAAAHVLSDSDFLEIDAQPGSFGVAADRIVTLGGRQELSIHLADTVPDNAALRLKVECAEESNSSLAQIVLHPGDKSGKIYFDGGNCAYGNLALSFTVNEGRRAATLEVARILLRKV